MFHENIQVPRRNLSKSLKRKIQALLGALARCFQPRALGGPTAVLPCQGDAQEDERLVYAYTNKQVLLWANGAFCQAFGGMPENVKGRQLGDFLPPEAIEAIEGFQGSAQAENSNKYGNFIYKVPDLGQGEAWYFSEIGRVNGGGDGEKVFHSIDRDFTKYKNKETAIIRDQEQLNDLLNLAPVVLFAAEISPPYAITYVSENVQSLFGYDAEDFIAKADFWLSKVYPDHKERVMDSLANLFSTGRQSISFKFQDAAGAYRCISGVVRPVSYDGVLKIAGYWADTTEKTQAQEALAEAKGAAKKSAQELDCLFSLSGDPMCIIDAQGRLTRVNPAWELFGHDLEDLLGNFLHAYLHGDDAEQVRENLAALHGHKKHLNFDARVRCKQGGYRWLSWAVTADDQGQSVYAIAHDISLVKKQESELLKAKEQALEACRIKSDFLASMSHEIRPPMNTLVGSINLLKETDLTPKQREYGATIESAGQALAGLINDILDYASLDAGKFTLESVPFNLHECLHNIDTVIQPKAQENELNFSIAIEGDVPMKVVGDPVTVRLLLVHLIENAIKFTEHGAVSVRVSLGKKTEIKNEILFEVIDTGAGISKAEQHLIFEEFSRVNSTKLARAGGAGLGLAICKKLVTLMGGKIGVESTLGKGSCFWVVLPLQGVAHGGEDSEMLGFSSVERPMDAQSGRGSAFMVKESAQKKAAKKKEENKKISILLVEGNETNQQLAKAVLGKRGYVVDGAANGQEALSMLDEKCYSIILMEVLMPIMDGYETARAIRGRKDGSHKTPIIALTAFASQEDKQRAKSAGIDAFTTKPLDFDVLEDTLDRWTATAPDVVVAQDGASGGAMPTDGQWTKIPSKTPKEDFGPTGGGKINGGKKTSEETLNLAVLNQLRTLLPAESLEEILNNFLDDAPQRAARMVKAAQERHFDALQEEAHALCAMAGNVGAARLSSLAKNIQATCREGQGDLILDAMKGFAKGADAAIKAVRGYVETL